MQVEGVGYLKGGTVRACLVFHNQGVADADVEPEVCSVEAQHSVICLCGHTHTLSAMHRLPMFTCLHNQSKVFTQHRHSLRWQTCWF